MSPEFEPLDAGRPRDTLSRIGIDATVRDAAAAIVATLTTPKGGLVLK